MVEYKPYIIFAFLFVHVSCLIVIMVSTRPEAEFVHVWFLHLIIVNAKYNMYNNKMFKCLCINMEMTPRKQKPTKYPTDPKTLPSPKLPHPKPTQHVKPYKK